MTPQQLAEASAEAMWKGDAASQGMGMRLDRIAPGQATLSMEVTPAMSNGHGSCHGGYIFSLADSAFAFACNAYGQVTVGQSCHIAYIAPGRVGDRLTATAREVSRQGRSGVYDVQVTDPQGAVIAEFRGLSRAVNATHLPGDGTDAQKPRED